MEEDELPITRLLCHAKRFVRFWQEEGVLKGQELENTILDSDYMKSIQIAFELHRPHKLFELFAEISRLAISFPLHLRFQIMLAYILIKYRGQKSDRESPSCFADAITNLAYENSSIKTCVRWYPSC